MDPRRSKEPENLNLLAIVAFALLAVIGWQYYQKPLNEKETYDAKEITSTKESLSIDSLKAPAIQEPENTLSHREKAETRRIPVESNLVFGSIALTGGRLDELSLQNYMEELNGEKHVTIFAPEGHTAHFFDAGWQSTNAHVPTGNTTWETTGTKLTTATPLVLSWTNDAGQTFTRTFTLEKDGYTVRIVDEVINRASTPLSIGHYAQIHKAHHKINGNSPEKSTFYNFLGPLAFIDNLKVEHDYEDIKNEKMITQEGTRGWTGMKSRYFLAAIIPDQQNAESWKFKHSYIGGKDFYSTIVQMPNPVTVSGNGGTYTKSYRIYAGPNIRAQMAKETVGLEQAVDYGWFHIFALPLFKMLMWIGEWSHNLGIAIILGTITLKILLFPLANRSYHAMARMKKLQPELTKLKEKHGDNREAAALEMMSLYKKYNVNPMSGCWPVLLQIPVFFAFYKVILVSFEFRHAPFFGWIVDLSSKDPYFILPIIMGITMYIQQTLNPSSGDPMQDKVMKALPIIFTFMFMMFPSGLVLYWVVNNILSITQQWFIMKRDNAV